MHLKKKNDCEKAAILSTGEMSYIWVSTSVRFIPIRLCAQTPYMCVNNIHSIMHHQIHIDGLVHGRRNWSYVFPALAHRYGLPLLFYRYIGR